MKYYMKFCSAKTNVHSWQKLRPPGPRRQSHQCRCRPIGLKLPVRKEIKVTSNEICILHECLGKNGTKCGSDP